jgi:hypothetical protein
MPLAPYIEIEDKLSKAAKEGDITTFNQLLEEAKTVENANKILYNKVFKIAAEQNCYPIIVALLPSLSTEACEDISLSLFLDPSKKDICITLLIAKKDYKPSLEATSMCYNNKELVKYLHQNKYEIDVKTLANRALYFATHQNESTDRSMEVMSYIADLNLLTPEEVNNLARSIIDHHNNPKGKAIDPEIPSNIAYICEKFDITSPVTQTTSAGEEKEDLVIIGAPGESADTI